jgi:hypothetical protein
VGRSGLQNFEEALVMHLRESVIAQEFNASILLRDCVFKAMKTI